MAADGQFTPEVGGSAVSPSLTPAGYSPVQLDPLPIPKATELHQEMPVPQINQVPAGAGFSGGAGQISNVAANFLQGWVKGKQMASDAALKKAQFQVESATAVRKQAIDVMQNLQAAGVPETDPRWEAATKSASAAFQHYKDTLTKFIIPQEPSSVGGKIARGAKKALTPGSVPELFAQQAIAAQDQFIQNPRLALAPMTPEQQVRRGDAERALRVNQSVDAMGKLYEKNAALPLEQWSNEDKAALGNYRQQVAIGAQGRPYVVSPEERKAQMVNDVFTGASKNWTPEQRNVALQMGVLRANSTTMLADKASGTYWAITTDPEGNVVKQSDTGRSMYTPYPNMEEQLRQQYGALKYIWLDGHPGDDAGADAFARESVTGGNQRFRNSEQTNNKLDQAIRRLRTEVGTDQAAKFNNFLAQDQGGSGQWMLRSMLIDSNSPDVKKPWFWGEDTYPGGLKRSELPGMELQMRGMLRGMLQREGLSDQEISTAMGPLLTQGMNQPQNQNPANPQGQAKGNINPPPVGAPEAVVVTIPGQPPQLMNLTASDQQAYQARWKARGIQGTIAPAPNATATPSAVVPATLTPPPPATELVGTGGHK